MVYNCLNRIVGARPGSRASSGSVALDNGNNRPVGSCNHQEATSQDDKDTPTDHEDPLGCTTAILTLMPVVIKPHTTHWLEAHGGSEQGADERDKIAENGNGAGDYICDDGGGDGAAEPDCPMSKGVGCQVAGALEDANEDVFSGDLGDMLRCGIWIGRLRVILTWMKSRVLTSRPGRANP